MNGNEQLGFIAGFPGCGVQQWERNKDRWQWINSSCSAARAGCSAVLVPTQQQPQPCPAAGKWSLVLCRVRYSGDGEKRRVCPDQRAEQCAPVLLLCSKHALKSKEIHRIFLLLFDWWYSFLGLFSVWKPQKEKRKKKLNEPLWNFSCFNAKGICFLKVAVFSPLRFCPFRTTESFGLEKVS